VINEISLDPLPPNFLNTVTKQSNSAPPLITVA